MDTTNLTIKGSMTARTVLAAVTKVTGVSRPRILSDSRKWPVTEARMLACVTLFSLGLPDYKIAMIIKRQRSTACKSRHAAARLIGYSKSFRTKLQQIQTILNTSTPQQNEK